MPFDGTSSYGKDYPAHAVQRREGHGPPQAVKDSQPFDATSSYKVGAYTLLSPHWKVTASEHMGYRLLQQQTAPLRRRLQLQCALPCVLPLAHSFASSSCLWSTGVVSATQDCQDKLLGRGVKAKPGSQRRAEQPCCRRTTRRMRCRSARRAAACSMCPTTCLLTGHLPTR